MTTHVITHFPCNDGFTAAFLLKQRFPDATFHGVNHGSTPPAITGAQVIFADFCYPEPQMRSLIENNVSVEVYDHHKGVEDVLIRLKTDYPTKFNYIFNNDCSGAGIVADEFGFDRTYMINAIEANDLWKADADQKAFVEYVRSQPQTHENLYVWNILDENNVRHAVQSGHAIMAAKMQMVQQAVAFKRTGTAHGYTFNYTNVPFFLCSETAHAVRGDNPVGVTWYQDADGRYKLSFRSVDGKSAMLLAKLCGGNGHEDSAGATVSQLPWEIKPHMWD